MAIIVIITVVIIIVIVVIFILFRRPIGVTIVVIATHVIATCSMISMNTVIPISTIVNPLNRVTVYHHIARRELTLCGFLLASNYFH